MIEFQTLKQILCDIEDKLKNDIGNISLETNSITWRKYFVEDNVGEGSPALHDLSKYAEMTVWITDHSTSAAPNRFEKTIYLKVRTVRGDSASIEIKLKKLDMYRYSMLKFKYLMYKAKKLRIKHACLDLDKKLATVNSDRIDKILLGGNECQTESKNESKPSGNILPAADKSKK